MNNYIILSEKTWNANLAFELAKNIDANWILISNKENFSLEEILLLKPNKIFIPHWSYIIPSVIYESFECIVFHMTDLPYGRGGSPLQNLILNGYNKTKISAIKVGNVIDAGDVYLKKDLDLHGSAKDIFERANHIIFNMIIEILKTKPMPINQTGEIVTFKRRTPEMSSIENIDKYEEIYDYIRMLDAEGYPNAFLETLNFRFEFSDVSKQKDNILNAYVRIIKK